jgi:hypothetical protein
MTTMTGRPGDVIGTTMMTVDRAAGTMTTAVAAGVETTTTTITTADGASPKTAPERAGSTGPVWRACSALSPAGSESADSASWCSSGC